MHEMKIVVLCFIQTGGIEGEDKCCGRKEEGKGCVLGQEAASLTIRPQGPIQKLSPQTPSNVVFTRSTVNPALLHPLQLPVDKLPFSILPVSLSPWEGCESMCVYFGSCKQRLLSLSI